MNVLKMVALAWAHADVNGIRIRIPFDENIPEYGPNHFQFAKGSLGEITRFTAARCPHRTPAEISDWMAGDNDEGLRVGVDCSGFVYMVLDQASIASGAPGLEKLLGTDKYFTNAEMLTNFRNQAIGSEIHQAQSVRPGDVLRCHGGGHVAVVIDVATDPDGAVREIWYAHSGFSGGPHISWIEVREPEADLSDSSTDWHEAAEPPELVDNHFRDEYFERAVRTHYYRGDRSMSVKVPVAVQWDGTPIEPPLTPFIREGISLAPVRPLAEAMGASVSWEAPTQSVSLTWRDRRATFQIAATRAQGHSGIITLATPPELILNQAVVPLRGLAQALGLQVHWEPSPPTVHLGE